MDPKPSRIPAGGVEEPSMSDSAEPICFFCSQAFQVSGQLNRMPDGRPCPICANRLMESLPPLMPGGMPAGRTGETESVQGEQAHEFDVDEDRESSLSSPVRFRVVEDRPEPA